MSGLKVITGDGARKFLDIFKNENDCVNTMFLTIDPNETNIDVNDEKSSRAVMEVLTKLADENDKDILVINHKQERMQGHLGTLLDRMATEIYTAQLNESGRLYIVERKIRRYVETKTTNCTN